MIEELGNYYKMFDGFSLQLLDLSFNHITALQPNTLVVSYTVVLQLIGQLRFDFRYDIVMACKIIEWPALTVGRGNRTAEEEQSNFSSSLVKDQQRPCAALHDCTGELVYWPELETDLFPEMGTRNTVQCPQWSCLGCLGGLGEHSDLIASIHVSLAWTTS